jgi:hypothetical protein
VPIANCGAAAYHWRDKHLHSEAPYVHVLVRRADFAKTLGEMRQWLDRHNRPLVRFETEADGDTITVKVQFDADDLAELFREAFQGSYGD